MKKSLADFIREKIDDRDYAVQGICNSGSIFVAFADTDQDSNAWEMAALAGGTEIVYSWFQTVDNDKPIAPSRQVIKWGVKPEICDGGDLTAYITKHGVKYWLDDFIRCF